ncbi:hypothetical protein MPSEU_000627400 [Mayamaea pseudoterrestris]|nr:hypothetical protein MPSEU_000627400 [Mayamaea pseudoterrestris]
MMMRSGLLLLLLPSLVNAKVDFTLNGRFYVPSGYKNGTTQGAPDLYGYGFGGLESSYYDASEKIFYGGSELGFITVTDFGDWPNAKLAPFDLPLEFDLTDIVVCGELLMIATKDDPNPGAVQVYQKSKRGENGTLSPPEFIQSVTVGYGPDYIMANENCSIVATANEGEGYYDDTVGLVNPEGSVSILRGPFDDASSPPFVTTVSLNEWSDDELIAQNVHLPLSLNAMIYYNSLNMSDFNVNFSGAIANYTTAAVLEPEYMAWNEDESKIYVSLQENNALVIVDVASGVAESIHSYGLKDHSKIPIDIVEDGACVLQTIEGLQTLRSPDAIVAFSRTLGSRTRQYILTANEGDDLEYEDFAERVSGGDVFVGAALAYSGMTASESVFDPSSLTKGSSRFYNSACDETNEATPFCQDAMRFTLGTSSVDYSNPEAPNIFQLVGIGGRGVSLFEVTGSGLELVWDSQDEFERLGCASFPFAHNSIQDEEFSPVGGAFYNSLPADDGLRETIDEMNDPDEDGCVDGGNGESGACPLKETVDERSAKDGPSPATVVFGNACGEQYMATSNEKNGIGYVYHLPVNGSSPCILSTFHLSPVSESLNAGLAYEAGTLGEVDAESLQFLSEEDSPTGKAAILFAGAWSSTVSLWEFNCVDEALTVITTTDAATSDADTTSDAVSTPFMGSAILGAMYALMSIL